MNYIITSPGCKQRLGDIYWPVSLSRQHQLGYIVTSPGCKQRLVDIHWPLSQSRQHQLGYIITSPGCKQRLRDIYCPWSLSRQHQPGCITVRPSCKRRPVDICCSVSLSRQHQPGCSIVQAAIVGLYPRSRHRHVDYTVASPSTCLSATGSLSHSAAPAALVTLTPGPTASNDCWSDPGNGCRGSLHHRQFRR